MRQVNFPALAKQMAECYQAVGVKQASQQGAQAKSGVALIHTSLWKMKSR